MPCLMTNHRCWFIGSKISSWCIRAPMPELVDVYVSKLLNDKMDLTGTVEMLVDSQRYGYGMEAQRAEGELMNGLCPKSSFSHSSISRTIFICPIQSATTPSK